MPSIEIACTGLTAPVALAAQGFDVACETGLKSHCVPARFQADFDALDGCLYRLGKPAARNAQRRGAFSAYELLSPRSREAFPASSLEFAPQHAAEVAEVLASILRASPRGEVLFTSDWQFGPEWAYRFGPLTLAEFWRLHAAGTLYLNTAYVLAA